MRSAQPGGRREEPELARASDRFGAAVRVELRVDVTEVRLDRVDRDLELGGDLGRLQVAGQVPENTQFGGAELVECRRSVSLRRRRSGHHIVDVGVDGASQGAITSSVAVGVMAKVALIVWSAVTSSKV